MSAAAIVQGAGLAHALVPGAGAPAVQTRTLAAPRVAVIAAIVAAARATALPAFAMPAALLAAITAAPLTAIPERSRLVHAVKPTMLGWFVGQVMKASGGKTNPAAVNDILKAKLGI